jgi:hypothetical protein
VSALAGLAVIGSAGAGVMPALVAPALAGGPRRDVCVQYRCKTVAADVTVKVVQARNRHPAREATFEASFARWQPTGRVTAVGDSFFEGRALRRLALSGRFVAAAIEGFAKEPPSAWRVSRLDARTGKREVVSAVPPSENQFELHSPGVTDICVTPAGSITWIVAPTAGTPGVWRVVEIAAGSSALQVLASGATVERGSLACVSGHVYWTEGTVAKSAPIK